MCFYETFLVNFFLKYKSKKYTFETLILWRFFSDELSYSLKLLSVLQKNKKNCFMLLLRVNLDLTNLSSLIEKNHSLLLLFHRLLYKSALIVFASPLEIFR